MDFSKIIDILKQVDPFTPSQVVLVCAVVLVVIALGVKLMSSDFGKKLIGANTQELLNINNRVVSLETAVTAVASKLDAMHLSIDSKTNSILDGIRGQIATLKSNLDTSIQAVEKSLISDNKDTRVAIREVGYAVQDCVRQVASLHSQLVVLSATIPNIANDLKEVEHDVASLMSQADRLNAYIVNQIESPHKTLLR